MKSNVKLYVNAEPNLSMDVHDVQFATEFGFDVKSGYAIYVL